MVNNEVNVDLVRAARKTTLHVTIKRKQEMKVRMWIASQFIKLAAWIMNMGIEFEKGDIAEW